MRHFVHQAKEKLGEKFGEHFIAITDPGSKLEGEAKAMNFRRIFHGLPGVGGPLFGSFALWRCAHVPNWYGCRGFSLYRFADG